MKTLIDINDELMADLLQTAGTTVKKEAVITAITAYLKQKKREQLAAMIHNYTFGYSAEDLERLREDG